MINQLKNLLEGATVISVEDIARREAICQITVRKNNKEYSFSLYGNDLGTWVSDIKDSENVLLDFQDLIEEAFNHLNDVEDFAEDIFICVENAMKRTLGFKCKKCGQQILTSLTAVKNSEYSMFLTTPEKRAKFAKVLGRGYILNPDMVEEGIKSLQ
jgi:hypothetical protein